MASSSALWPFLRIRAQTPSYRPNVDKQSLTGKKCQLKPIDQAFSPGKSKEENTVPKASPYNLHIVLEWRHASWPRGIRSEEQAERHKGKSWMSQCG